MQQPDSINLMPEDRQKAFLESYFFRLGTVALILLTLLVIAHGVMLAPSYLFISEQIRVHEDELEELEAGIAEKAGDTVGAELASLETSVRALAKLKTATSGSDIIIALLEVSSEGILLSNIVLEAPRNEGDGRIALTGRATTRDALRNYVEELSSLPFVSSVDLPISAYARETDIPFSITVIGTLRP
jgi:hypothetical protein